MSAADDLRIAAGCITRFIESTDPYQDFVANAREHGVEIDVLIIAMTRSADIAVLSELNDFVPIEVIEIGDDEEIADELVAAGAHGADVDALIDTTPYEDFGLVPFCAQRNAVLLKALLLGVDYLCFFDHTMRPVELVGDPDSTSGRAFRPVDFFGPHAKALDAGAAVTTGGYSGFDPFPPIHMPALRDLLHGIGREEAFDVVSAEGALAGLHLASPQTPEARPSPRAFAGNLGLNLHRAPDLPPFFSRWYRMGDDIVLTRGEDTLLAAAAVKAQIGCIDVGTRVFLDPHVTYPDPPDLSRSWMHDRLYWNCLGWIARLPLLDHVRHDSGLVDWSPDNLQASRRLALQQGASELAEALEDNRFYDLPTFFDLAHMRLRRTLEEYEATQRAWRRVVDVIRPRTSSIPKK